MKKIQLTTKFFNKIKAIAIEKYKNKAVNSDNFRFNIIVESTIEFIGSNNIFINKGNLIKYENNVEYENEIKKVYDKLSEENKHRYLVNVEKVQLLHELQLAKKEIKNLQKVVKELKLCKK